MILTVTLNPSLDRLIYVDKLLVNDTNRITSIEEDAGGKGVNVARVLYRLDIPVTATGFLGGPAGRYVDHVLSHEGVPTSFVHVTGETRTNIAVQESDGSPPTALNAKGPEITPQEMLELRAKVHSLASACDYVCLGGSLPPGLPKDTYNTLAAIASERGAKVVLDADGDALKQGISGRPYLIKPNGYEIGRLIGRSVETLEDAAKAASEVIAEGPSVVIVSMGSLGAVVNDGKSAYAAKPPVVQTVSTIGSGDSLIAGFLSIVSNGGGIDEGLRWGCAAGAATAMTDGADIGSAANIRELASQVEVWSL